MDQVRSSDTSGQHGDVGSSELNSFLLNFDWNDCVTSGTQYNQLDRTRQIDNGAVRVDDSDPTPSLFDTTSSFYFEQDQLQQSLRLPSPAVEPAPGNAASGYHESHRTNTPISSQSAKGVRFSRESLKVLKRWFSSNEYHPYPRGKDLEFLQDQTGLSRQQITMWFANARRRSKPANARKSANSSLPLTKSPIICATRPEDGLQDMSPLERWRNSPPELEPADAAAITKAMLVNFDSLPDRTFHDFSTENSAILSYNASSASSAVTSDSNNSASSACSYGSNMFTLSAVSSHSLSRRRSGLSSKLKRKKEHRQSRYLKRYGEASKRPGAQLAPTTKPFQCTFCTQTFRTKHNWQRHEKTLHLSLESWVCSPHGPITISSAAETACVYCGVLDPDENHLKTHNSESCLQRSFEERTFFRKDHLDQHLKLVHQSKYCPLVMDSWRSEMTMISSRCGFCGIGLRTWLERTDHLAYHFRSGKTMGDWEGDWGFEPRVLEMVENSMPPYLIDYERYSPFPFKAQYNAPSGPTSAYELLELELEYFHSNFINANNHPPSAGEMQHESCRIIFASDVISADLSSPSPSWLRDLLLSTESITAAARSQPIKTAARSRITELMIHGKSHIFEACNVEAALLARVKTLTSGEPDVEDDWLQKQASDVIKCVGSTPSLQIFSDRESGESMGVFPDFLIRLINQSRAWLPPFRERAGLNTHDDVEPEAYNADNLAISDSQNSAADLFVCMDEGCSESMMPSCQPSVATKQNGSSAVGSSLRETGPNTAYLDDGNFYRRLVCELSRYIASATSSRNPNQHTPSDQELQHQARWIMYDDDDPWNQTPADNPHWLRDFKRLVRMNEGEDQDKMS